jgi:hypothetical protein
MRWPVASGSAVALIGSVAFAYLAVQAPEVVRLADMIQFRGDVPPDPYAKQLEAWLLVAIVAIVGGCALVTAGLGRSLVKVPLAVGVLLLVLNAVGQARDRPEWMVVGALIVGVVIGVLLLSGRVPADRSVGQREGRAMAGYSVTAGCCVWLVTPPSPPLMADRYEAPSMAGLQVATVVVMVMLLAVAVGGGLWLRGRRPPTAVVLAMVFGAPILPLAVGGLPVVTVLLLSDRVRAVTAWIAGSVAAVAVVLLTCGLLVGQALAGPPYTSVSLVPTVVLYFMVGAAAIALFDALDERPPAWVPGSAGIASEGRVQVGPG